LLVPLISHIPLIISLNLDPDTSDIDNYMLQNKRANQANELKKKPSYNSGIVVRTRAEYPNVAPIAHLDDPVIVKAKNEQDELLPIQDQRVDLVKQASKGEPEIYEIKQFAKKVRCPRRSCGHIWYYRGHNLYTICGKCHAGVAIKKCIVR
jgi:hypothetical protein